MTGAVLTLGVITGAVGAGIVGFFVGPIIVGTASGAFHLPEDRVIVGAAAAISIPLLLATTALSGRSLLLDRHYPLGRETLAALLAVEALVAVPVLGVRPWLDEGVFHFGPPWSWPLLIGSVALLVRFLVLRFGGRITSA